MSSLSREVDLVRTVSFSAAHRYFDRAISDQENRDLYGSLYREKGFGHNFLLEAHFRGPVDPLTGMVVNLSLVDAWLKDFATLVDHRHLNELEAFAGKAPTPERIARYAHMEIQARIDKWLAQQPQDPLGLSTAKVRLAKVRLYEGPHLWVDYLNA